MRINRNTAIWGFAILIFLCVITLAIGGLSYVFGENGMRANLDQPEANPSLFQGNKEEGAATKGADKANEGETPQSEALPESQDLPDQKESESKTLSEACWAYTDPKHGEWVNTNMKQVNGLWEIDFGDFLKYAKSNDGQWMFEGRLPEYRNEDRTDIFFPETILNLGKFKFVEGSFWLIPNDCANSDKGKVVAEDFLAGGKWNGREEQNKLEGFTMVLHDPTDKDKGWTFTINNPYNPITEEGAKVTIKSCKGLKEPQLQKYFGELGEVENYSFGAIGCNSVTIGNFPTGYGAMFFKNANDNIGVVYDEDMKHFIFPATWDAEKIQKWLDKNYPNITVFDPEGVLK